MSAEERVVVVNEINEVTGSAPRAQLRAQNLRHRATYIFVFNDGGELCVPRRTLSKDLYPGYLDLACGGVVLADESYEESAQREAEEELGIRNVPLAPQFEFYFEDPHCRVFGKAFTCVHNGPFALQSTEVESVFFARDEEVLATPGKRYTPDTLYAFERLLQARASA